MSTQRRKKEEAAHSDEVDNEGVEEPVQELAKQFSPLIDVRCGRSLMARGGTCRGKPVAVQDGEAL